MGETDTVLVVTEKNDAHADFVIRRLAELSVPVVRLNTEDFPRSVSLSVERRDGRWHGRINTGVHSVDLAGIRSAWFRRPAEPEVAPDLADNLRDYSLKQARAALWTLYSALDGKWLASPMALRLANLKAMQIAKAEAVGLSVPPTLTTNDAGDAAAFRARLAGGGDSCAIKALAIDHAYVYRGRWWFPHTVVWGDDWVPDGRDLASTPTVFQRYVDKMREVRAVVVGETVHAASTAASDGDGEYDIRAGEGRRPYVAHDLPAQVQRQLRELVSGFGISFCSADLLLGTDGRYFFLELNPNGQWLWLELGAGLPITATLADWLVDPGRSSGADRRGGTRDQPP